MKKTDVVVVGGGVGGLCAAILLGAKGRRVTLLERASQLGGKAGTQEVDGVTFDTGPSVLTLPQVFDEVLKAAGLEPREVLPLVRSSPAFRYLYPDGTCLDIHHELDATLTSVESTLGARARSEFQTYLQYSREIWDAAAPHFVMAAAPDVTSLLLGGIKSLGVVSKIDAFTSLEAAIERRVKSPHLRMLLKRYATYNGSDVRRAPATLGCIAHVELALGGYGVRGGMGQLVCALQEAARRVNVSFELSADAEEIIVTRGKVTGVRLADGRTFECAQVVANADVGHLKDRLLKADRALFPTGAPSMSAYTGVYRAARTSPGRVAHTVLFPENYREEFADIFDRKRVPKDPTLYLCAQEPCHQRTGWADAEPVFAMMNAPSLSDSKARPLAGEPQEEDIRSRIEERLQKTGLLSSGDACVWWRTPSDLARQFPGSGGAIYGAASSERTAAFRRPPNRVKRIAGLYLASGSAHPGGGLPMVAQSGKQAARAALEDAGVY